VSDTHPPANWLRSLETAQISQGRRYLTESGALTPESLVSRANPYAAAVERRIDGMTRDEMCNHMRRKIVLIARRVFLRQGGHENVTVDDLASCGALGLLEAFDRYDASRGVAFGAYAEYRIRGAMFDALRSEDAFSRRRRNLAKRVTAAAKMVEHRKGRDGTPREIAEELEITLEEYWDVVDKVKPVQMSSLDQPPGDESMDNDIYMKEVKAHLKAAILGLPDRERETVLFYYGKDMTQAEIAEVYEVTVPRISQILSSARGRLRKKLLKVVDGTTVAGAVA
jgi:RNA polymerase sigma factor for flagellar operon FliA